MSILISISLIVLLSLIIGTFYFYRKYNKIVLLDKNINLATSISINGAKREISDVRSSLKILKEKANSI